MGKRASKVIKTLENTELYHPLLAPVRNCKMMKMPMSPTGPSVLVSVGLVSIWNRDTYHRNSCVSGRIVVGALATHSLPSESK